MSEQLYRWHWRARLPERRGELFRVLARGTLNACLIEFLSDGKRVVTRRNALRKACLALAILAGLAGPALAYRKVDVVDGDTITVSSGGTTTGYRVRVMGLDAPEMHGQCASESALARRAKARLEQLVAGGVTFLTDLEADRYGRLLAQVLDPQKRDVAQILIGEGLAHAYDGKGPRQPWCPAPAAP